MLHINNPESAAARSKVKPLTMEEEHEAIRILNNALPFNNELIQRLIYNYENLKHFKAAAGGWYGLHKAQKAERKKNEIELSAFMDNALVASKYINNLTVTDHEVVKTEKGRYKIPKLKGNCKY